MAHGLEVRAPFLEATLAEYALALPPELKCGRTGRPKRLLRMLARQIFGPAIADAPKQGFSIPVHRWLRDEARPLMEDLLSPASLAAIPELDASAVRAAVEAHLGGRRSYGFELWGLMVLSAWHARYIRQPRPRPAGPPAVRVEIAPASPLASTGLR